MDALKDWLLVLLAAATILVTLYTVYKQNKIALFEIRYKTYNVLCFLFSTTETLLNSDITYLKVVLHSSMDTYKSSTTLNETLPSGNDISSFYTGLLFEAGKAEHIFAKKHIKDVIPFLLAFNDLVSCIYTKKSYTQEVKQLHEIYSKLEKNNISNKLKEYLEL